jgi:hypothetical protein
MPRLTLAKVSELSGTDVRKVTIVNAAESEVTDVADLGPCVELRKLGELAHPYTLPYITLSHACCGRVGARGARYQIVGSSQGVRAHTLPTSSYTLPPPRSSAMQTSTAMKSQASRMSSARGHSRCSTSPRIRLPRSLGLRSLRVFRYVRRLHIDTSTPVLYPPAHHCPHRSSVWVRVGWVSSGAQFKLQRYPKHRASGAIINAEGSRSQQQRDS